MGRLQGKTALITGAARGIGHAIAESFVAEGASVLLTDQSNHTITVWLSYFYGTSRNTDWGGLMAASTLTAIPVVVFFLLVQRRIAFGLTSGAVRG